MKKLIVVLFVLLMQQTIAQNPAQKAVIYVPVHPTLNAPDMPLEYNTQTTRMVQVLEAPQPQPMVPSSTDS